MWGQGYPAAYGASTLSFLVAVVAAVVVVMVVAMTVVPALEKRWRFDLVPWVVFGSFFIALMAGMMLFPHLISDRITGK